MTGMIKRLMTVSCILFIAGILFLSTVIASAGASSNLITAAFAGTSRSFSYFLWPVPGYGADCVTDGYGPRIHPLSGLYSFHTGTDIGVPYYTPIVASAPGTVTRASMYGGYGNCVMIDCVNSSDGNKWSLLYGHMSSFNCEKGDFVCMGDVIGYAGSTGDSNGPHLHIEIKMNGSTVDPMEWLTPDGEEPVRIFEGSDKEEVE